jgi:hypothetical protein
LVYPRDGKTDFLPVARLLGAVERRDKTGLYAFYSYRRNSHRTNKNSLQSLSIYSIASLISNRQRQPNYRWPRRDFAYVSKPTASTMMTPMIICW